MSMLLMFRDELPEEKPHAFGVFSTQTPGRDALSFVGKDCNTNNIYYILYIIVYYIILLL